MSINHTESGMKKKIITSINWNELYSVGIYNEPAERDRT